MDNVGRYVIFNNYAFWQDVKVDELHELYQIESKMAYTKAKTFDEWRQSQQVWIKLHDEIGYFATIEQLQRPFLCDQKLLLDGLFPEPYTQGVDWEEYSYLLSHYENWEEANMRILLAAKRWDSYPSSPFFN